MGRRGKFMGMKRRDVVIGSLAGALASRAGIVQAAPLLAPTGQETFGPFYPVRGPRGHDLDLTHFPGRKGQARGQLMTLSGRVLDRSGKPLPGARITLWQANAAGRYTNPVDTNPAPIDPNFLGVVDFQSGPDGSYRIRTVKPGPYPEPSGTIRTPHIHFDVSHADYRLVTQMYFPGEPLNEKDILLSTLAARRRNPANAICTSVASSEPNLLAFTFDLVLLA
jgi:protocatechuate 3,4-dioxygenase beta subunit